MWADEVGFEEALLGAVVIMLRFGATWEPVSDAPCARGQGATSCIVTLLIVMLRALSPVVEPVALN